MEVKSWEIYAWGMATGSVLTMIAVMLLLIYAGTQP
jgi:hypothetical protein